MLPMWFWWLPKFGNTDVVSLFLNIVGGREPIPLKALYSTLHGYSYWGKTYFLLDLTSTPWRPHRTFQISFPHDNSSDICRQLSCPSWAFSFGQKNHILSWLLKKWGWIDTSNLISGNTELQDLQLLFDTKGPEEWGCWDSRRQEILNERQGYTLLQRMDSAYCMQEIRDSWNFLHTWYIQYLKKNLGSDASQGQVLVPWVYT